MQLLKFAVSYKASGRKIKKLSLDEILASGEMKSFMDEKVTLTRFRNPDALLDHVVFED